MHPDFPLDPYTIAIGVVALLAGAFGVIGGAGNAVVWGLLLFFLFLVPLLLIEYFAFFVYERFIEPRLE